MNFLGVENWGDFLLGGACATAVCLAMVIIVCGLALSSPPDFPSMGPPRQPRSK